MATKFKKEEVVRVKTVVPQGPVIRFKMDEDSGEVIYLIGWTDANGDTQERWFAEAELEIAA